MTIKKKIDWLESHPAVNALFTILAMAGLIGLNRLSHKFEELVLRQRAGDQEQAAAATPPEAEKTTVDIAPATPASP